MGTLKEWEIQGVSLVRDTFIETGTRIGETLIEAMKQPFKRLVSMDLDQSEIDQALRTVGGDPRVTVIRGSSPDVLPLVMRKNEATTFWLDAHYMGDGTPDMDPKYGECPVLAELDAIRAVDWKVQPIIVIDDAYLFERKYGYWDTDRGKLFKPSHWPHPPEIQARAPHHRMLIDYGRINLLPRNANARTTTT